MDGTSRHAAMDLQAVILLFALVVRRVIANATTFQHTHNDLCEEVGRTTASGDLAAMDERQTAHSSTSNQDEVTGDDVDMDETWNNHSDEQDDDDEPALANVDIPEGAVQADFKGAVVVAAVLIMSLNQLLLMIIAVVATSDIVSALILLALHGGEIRRLLGMDAPVAGNDIGVGIE
ncbi:hypothetical protein BC831DRAFT_547255 [Entophlyctis helioformis]|nr:hypothetical protein BC831DRAFT_547255 [Entophlyctis helioformis]